MYTYLKNIVINSFKYTGDIPETFNIPYFETVLIQDGICGAYKKHSGDWIAIPGNYTGYVNDIGLGENFTGATPATSISGVPVKSENIGVCWNNDTRTPDTPILKKHANIISQLNVSISNLSRFAHYNNIFGVTEKKTKDAIENALCENAKGKPAVFVSENILDELIENNKVETVKVFDIQASTYFQYLSKMREDELSFILFLFGLEYGGGVKLAQQTEREIMTGNEAKMVYINEKLKQRKIFCKAMQEKGFNINVELSDEWKVALEEIKKDIKEDKKEGEEDETSSEDND